MSLIQFPSLLFSLIFDRKVSEVDLDHYLFGHFCGLENNNAAATFWLFSAGPNDDDDDDRKASPMTSLPLTSKAGRKGLFLNIEAGIGVSFPTRYSQWSRHRIV